MRRFGWVVFALGFLMLAGASAALAEKRIALLIGNEAYTTEIGRLANPHNDVALLEQALKSVGFDVAVERDAGLGNLTRAVNAYARRLQAAGPSAVGFFYYSGHGASDGSTNYLIPVDAKTTEAGELWDQSLQLTEITRKLKKDAGNATHFVVFDACRNTLKLTQPGARAVVQSKGFVPVTQENGMLIAYSTAEGELASDVGSAAGPYARVLADEIVKPGIEAVVMFRAVQRRVRTAISQEPYLGFNALGDVYLAGKDAKPTERAVGQSRLSEAGEEWDRIKDSTNVAMLETFISRYQDTFYAGLASSRVAQLTNYQTPHAAVVARPVGGVQVNFPILTGHCITEDSNARDAIFINRMSTLLRNANNNRLIVLSMDCGRRSTWRNGVDGNIYDYSTYYIPEINLTQTLKGDKAALRKALCNDMRKQGDATLVPIKDIVAKAEKELKDDNVTVSSTKMIGVVGEDQHACYSALLVGIRAAPHNILMSAFIIATVIRGKPFFSTIYHEYKGPETTQRSLEEAKSLAAEFDSRNP